VVFGNPSELGFTSMAVSPDSADITNDNRFAVFSAGELAFPHRVTVDDYEALYPLPVTIRLLRALFEQEKLAAALLPPAKRSMEAGPVADTLDRAIDLIGAYNALDLSARRIFEDQTEALVEPEVADPKPTLLAGPLDQSRAFPAPDGGTLLLLERPTLSSPKTESVALDPPGGFQMFHLPAGGVDIEARQPCAGLGGDRYFRDPRFVISPGTRAVGLLRDETLEVWTWTGSDGVCAWARAGAVQTEGLDGFLGDDGRWLRVVISPELQQLVVEIRTPDVTEPRVYPMTGCTRLGAPTWIGTREVAVSCFYDPEVARMLAAQRLAEQSQESQAESEGEAVPYDPSLAEPGPPQAWVYFINLATGEMIAEIWSTWSPEVLDGFGLQNVPTTTGTALLVTDGARFPRFLWTESASPFEMLGQVPPPEEVSRPVFAGEDPKVYRRLFGAQVVPLSLDTTARSVSPSPDGRHLVMEVDGGAFTDFGRNIAVYALPSGPTRRIANNPRAEHFAPRFTSDSGAVVFNSRYGTGEPRTAGRQAPLP
jgi:hypothetical protein